MTPTTLTSFTSEPRLNFLYENHIDQDKRHVTDCALEGASIYIDPESLLGFSTSFITPFAQSVVNNLPNELLAEIFISCWGEEGIGLGKKDFIYNLTKVSRRWREVVLGEPRLWTKFVLRFQECDKPELQENLHTLLRRSGSSPLTFILELPPSSVTYEAAKVRRRESTIRELVHHSERWQNVTFRGALMYGHADVLKDAKGKLGQLKSVTFTTRPSGAAITIFEKAPKLCEMAFSNFGDPKLHMSLPWAQITRLSMGPSAFFMGGFREIISRCPKLRELQWSGDSTVSMSSQPLVLPNLRVLKIETGILYLGKMLDAIAAPSLDTLDVTLDRAIKYGQEELADSIVLFLLRSCCSITTLALGSILAESVVKVVKEHPIIENLELNSMIVTPYLEKELMWLGHGVPCLAPKLRSIVLRDCHITCTGLEKIIRTRITGKCPTCLIRGKEDEQCKVMRLCHVSLCNVQYFDKSTSRAEGMLLYRLGNQRGLDFTLHSAHGN